MNTLHRWPQVAPRAPHGLPHFPAGLEHLATPGALERATLWPWIVEFTLRSGDKVTREIKILQRPMHDAPRVEDMLIEGQHLLRADVFPATRFDDMPAETRRQYVQHYAAFLRWRKAHAKGVAPADLVPWVDYDPVMLDESVQRWASVAGVRFAGD